MEKLNKCLNLDNYSPDTYGARFALRAKQLIVVYAILLVVSFSLALAVTIAYFYEVAALVIASLALLSLILGFVALHYRFQILLLLFCFLIIILVLCTLGDLIRELYLLTTEFGNWTLTQQILILILMLANLIYLPLTIAITVYSIRYYRALRRANIEETENAYMYE